MRFDMETEPVSDLTVEEAKGLSYAILDYIDQAQQLDEDVERCDSCGEHGSDFTRFKTATGGRGCICDGCAHAVYRVRLRKSWTGPK